MIPWPYKVLHTAEIQTYLDALALFVPLLRCSKVASWYFIDTSQTFATLPSQWRLFNIIGWPTLKKDEYPVIY